MGTRNQNLENSRTARDSSANPFLPAIYDGSMALETIELNWPSNDQLREALYCLVQSVSNIPRDVIACEMVKLREEVYGIPPALDHLKVGKFLKAIREIYEGSKARTDVPPVITKKQKIKDKNQTEESTRNQNDESLKSFPPEWVFLFCKAMGRLRPPLLYSFPITKKVLNDKNKKRGRKSKKNLPEDYQRLSLDIIRQTRKSLSEMFEEYVESLNWNPKSLKLNDAILTHIGIYGMDFMAWMGIHIHFLLQSGELNEKEIDERLRAILGAARGAAFNDLRKFNGYEEVAKSQFPLRPMATPEAALMYNYDSLKLIDQRLLNIFGEAEKFDSKVEKSGSHGATKRVQKANGKRAKKRRPKQKISV